MKGGIEFGDVANEILIVVKAIWTEKVQVQHFESFLAQTFDNMGFKSSIADPDIWMRPEIKSDGEEYCEYIICYVDDVLGASTHAKELVGEIKRDYKFKKDKIEPPGIHLGNRLELKSLNVHQTWTMCSKDYVKLAIANIEEQLKSKHMRLPGKALTPTSNAYAPELDVSPELSNDNFTFYQEIIAMLHWKIEIGQVDITTEVSLLSSYQAASREGHLEQLLRIVAYLKRKTKFTSYFDPEQPMIDEAMFNGSDWIQFLDQFRMLKNNYTRQNAKT